MIADSNEFDQPDDTARAGIVPKPRLLCDHPQMTISGCRVIGFCAALLYAGAAPAHGFGRLYTLPVPVWLYLYGAGAALILSFALVAFFVQQGSVARNNHRYELSRHAPFRALLHPFLRRAARLVGVALLGLTIVTGMFGSSDAYANLSMTQFWVVFVLGYAYFTALVGNTFAACSPWLTLCVWIERPFPHAFAGRFRLPESLGWWPALILYAAFIWFELFGLSRPHSLALALSFYTMFNLAGAALFGRAAWFRRVEFFAVMFELIGRMAPLTVDTRAGQPRLWLRQPFYGLATAPAAHLSLLVFVLFMLSSTSFDGIKSTIPYVRIFWVHVADWLVPLINDSPVRDFRQLNAIYAWWQAGVLLLSPFLYLAVYLLFLWFVKKLTGDRYGVRELGLRFAFTLLPIAFVYHVTHYYTLLLSQGPRIVRLASDPFGYGWNLFGTAKFDGSLLPQAGTIWHTQVGLILLGHVVSVYLAHLVAVDLYPDRRQAALSQLPILLLMVMLTTAGLWILSLPIQ